MKTIENILVWVLRILLLPAVLGLRLFGLVLYGDDWDKQKVADDYEPLCVDSL